MGESDCQGDHRYFVAEVVGVPDTGKVHVLVVCTNCGDFKSNEVAVGAPGGAIHLYREERGR